MSRGWLRSLRKVRSWVAERSSRRAERRPAVGLALEPLEARQLLSSLLSFNVSSASPLGTGVGATAAVQQSTLSLPVVGVSVSSVSTPAQPPAQRPAAVLPSPSFSTLVVGPPPAARGASVALVTPDSHQPAAPPKVPLVPVVPLVALASPVTPAPAGPGAQPPDGRHGLLSLPNPLPVPAPPNGQDSSTYWSVQVAAAKASLDSDLLFGLPADVIARDRAQLADAEQHLKSLGPVFRPPPPPVENPPGLQPGAGSDGSTRQQAQDGKGPTTSTTTSGTNADGSTWTQTRNSDGTTTATTTGQNPDGSTWTQTRNANGTTTTTVTAANEDGSTYQQTRNSNGTTTTTVTAPNADGSVYQQTQTHNSDGSTSRTTTLTAPNGDGSTYQQTQTQNSDGRTTHTTTLTAPNADGSVYQQTQTQTQGSTGTRNSTTTTLTAPNADGSVYQQTRQQTQFTNTTTTERSTTGSGGPSLHLQRQTGTGTSSTTTTSLTAPNADGSTYRQSQQQTQFSNSTTTGQVSGGLGGASYQQQTQDSTGTTGSTSRSLAAPNADGSTYHQSEQHTQSSADATRQGWGVGPGGAFTQQQTQSSTGDATLTSTTLTAPNADGSTYRAQTQSSTSVSTTTTTGLTVQLAAPDAPPSADTPPTARPQQPAADSSAQPSGSDLLPQLADRLGVRLSGIYGNDVAAVLKAAQDGGIPANTLDDVSRYLAIRQAALTPGAPAPADLKGNEQTAFNSIRATGDPNQTFIPVPTPAAPASQGTVPMADGGVASPGQNLLQQFANGLQAASDVAQKIGNGLTTLFNGLNNGALGVGQSIAADLPGLSADQREALNEAAKNSFANGPVQVTDAAADFTTHLYDKVLAPIVNPVFAAGHGLDAAVLTGISQLPGLPADQQTALLGEAERQLGDPSVQETTRMINAIVNSAPVQGTANFLTGALLSAEAPFSDDPGYYNRAAEDYLAKGPVQAFDTVAEGLQHRDQVIGGMAQAVGQWAADTAQAALDGNFGKVGDKVGDAINVGLVAAGVGEAALGGIDSVANLVNKLVTTGDDAAGAAKLSEGAASALGNGDAAASGTYAGSRGGADGLPQGLPSPATAEEQAARNVIAAWNADNSPINPLLGEPGTWTNCLNCATAQIRTWLGMPTTALPGEAASFGEVVQTLRDNFGQVTPANLTGDAALYHPYGFPEMDTTPEGIRQQLTDAGNGGMGIVLVERADGTKHVFAALNDGGAVRFSDPQLGLEGDFTDATRVHFYQVDPEVGASGNPASFPGLSARGAASLTGEADVSAGEGAAASASDRLYGGNGSPDNGPAPSPPPSVEPNLPPREDGNILYRGTDDQGRPLGIKALVTDDMIGTGSPAEGDIRPPGYVSTEDNVYARAHLLANLLGGAGDEYRNLVTMFQSANSPVMRAFEQQIAQVVKGTMSRDGSLMLTPPRDVLLEVTPIYEGDSLIPKAVEIKASSVDGSYQQGFSIFNQPTSKGGYQTQFRLPPQ